MKKILHFTADWCVPCKKIKPIIEQYVQENTSIDYVQINIDESTDLAKEYGVLSIPTLIVLVNNDMRARHTGVISADQLAKLVDKAK